MSDCLEGLPLFRFTTTAAASDVFAVVAVVAAAFRFFD